MNYEQKWLKEPQKGGGGGEQAEKFEGIKSGTTWYFYVTWHICSSCSWLPNGASDVLIFAHGLRSWSFKVEIG